MPVLIDSNTECISIADNSKWDFTPVTQNRALSIRWRSSSIPSNDGEYQVLFQLANFGSGNSLQIVLYNSSGTNYLMVQVLNSAASPIGYFYAPFSPSLNTWYHLVFNISSSGNNEIWINKSQQSETESGWDDNTQITPAYILISNGSAITGNMTIAYLSWFGDNLTSVEISNLYDNPTCMDSDSNILCSIPFNEGVDVTANDVQTVATQTNGTLVSSTTWASYAGTLITMYVDTDNGTDDAYHGLGQGVAAYASLDYALTQQARDIVTEGVNVTVNCVGTASDTQGLVVTSADGWVTNATYGIIVNGDWDGDGWDSAAYHLLVNNEDGIEISGSSRIDVVFNNVQVKITGTWNRQVIFLTNFTNGNHIFNNCWLEDAGTGGSRNIVANNDSDLNPVFNDCILKGGAYTSWLVACWSGSATLNNCVCNGGGTAGGFRCEDSGESITATNTVIFNTSDDFDTTQAGSYVCDYCASDDADATTYTHGIDWDSEATDWAANFTDYINGDYSVKDTGADIYHAGIAISGLNEDIVGYAWNDPPSIGAFEYVAAGGDTTVMPSAIGISAAPVTPIISGSSKVELTTIGIINSVISPGISAEALAALSALGIISSNLGPNVSGSAKVEPSALNINGDPKTPGISGSALISPDVVALLGSVLGVDVSGQAIIQVLTAGINGQIPSISVACDANVSVSLINIAAEVKTVAVITAGDVVIGVLPCSVNVSNPGPQIRGDSLFAASIINISGGIPAVSIAYGVTIQAGVCQVISSILNPQINTDAVIQAAACELIINAASPIITTAGNVIVAVSPISIRSAVNDVAVSGDANVEASRIEISGQVITPDMAIDVVIQADPVALIVDGPDVTVVLGEIEVIVVYDSNIEKTISIKSAIEKTIEEQSNIEKTISEKSRIEV